MVTKGGGSGGGNGRKRGAKGGGAEGIFRINPENSQEELVRDQLNRGILPHDIDVHCLAGLIKAWFRELPSGVLDGLSPEQVLGCDDEDKCVLLVEQLKPMDAGLLNWAVDLMADVVEQEEFNKMNECKEYCCGFCSEYDSGRCLGDC
ncbi:hypothetical protein V6N13_140325 [Hibiscus sabdariffa]